MSLVLPTSLGSGAVSALFLPLSLLRIWRLRKDSVKTKPSSLAILRSTTTSLFASVQIAILVHQALHNPQIDVQLICTSLATAASLSLIWLSRTELRRSVAPSDLIVDYVLVTELLDVAWLASPPAWEEDEQVRLLIYMRLGARVLVFITESWSKDVVLLDKYRSWPPETKTSALGRAFFWWINPILVMGYNNLLLDVDLPKLHHYLSATYLRNALQKTWRQSESTSLPLVLYRCFRSSFYSVVLPRVFLIVFRYSQPILIRYSIRFVTGTSDGMKGDDEAYLILTAAIVIYIGLAVSKASYQYGLNRLQVMIRGALTGLIHAKSMTVQSKAYGDGEAVALVTTEVTALESMPSMVHETWGQAVEVIIGIILLATQVGYLWPLPLGIILVCSQTSRYVANNLKSKTAKWNTATRTRLAMTSNVIDAIKNVKMLGLQGPISSLILNLREQELDAAGSFRRLMLIYNASANALGMFAPVLTLVVFAVLAEASGKPLDTETAFPTVAILTMITHPANMIMTIVPRAVAAYASVERLQAYLLRPDQDTHTAQPSEAENVNCTVSVRNVSVLTQETGNKSLDDVSLDLTQGSLTIVSGPVGAGKSVLARCILGEIEPSEGSIMSTSKDIAYCSQTPWLPAKSIKQIISGPYSEDRIDETWYRTVVQACCLQEDLDTLADNDNTLVGSKGLNLSGGQRQRVALARALYQRCELAILDDVCSALDGRTEAQLITNLFGPTGLFKDLGTTVLWITNSTNHFHLADDIIILDKKIMVQGVWDQLQGETVQISKLIQHDSTSAEEKPTSSKDKTSPRASQTVNESLQDLKRKNGDLSLYNYYFKSSGYANIIFMTACTASYAFFITFPQYWIKWWTEDGGRHTTLYTFGYFLLHSFAWITTCCLMGTATMLVAPRSGLDLHKRLVKTVAGASLGYFSATDSGVILNRFGQDLQLVDKQLPNSLSALIVQICKATMQAALLFAVQPWMTFSLPFCAAVLFVVQKVYLRTSRQLRLIELESKSAVYSSLLETTQGLETIRAFGWQQAMAEENVTALDASQRPFYLLLCLQRWLNLVLDLLVAGIAVTAISLAVALRGTTTGGEVGVALVVIISANATLLRLVESWTDLEVSLGAISRVKSAEAGIPQEMETRGEILPSIPGWPPQGGIDLRGATAAYNEDATALDNINLVVQPGSTVVICGRTGSGKSSLLLSLLRLLELEAGTILVDNVDISQVPLEVLRQRCFVTISQDPFLLPEASLRLNLDPSGSMSDALILSALDTTGCSFLLATGTEQGSEEAKDILQRPLSTLSALSGGQAQLLAVARAILAAEAISSLAESQHPSYASRPAKPIILLDEITSSLDSITEAAVYDILQTAFVDKGYTVVMVTHKLGTYADRLRPGKDKVVWMKQGRIEKVDDAEQISLS